MHWLLLFKIYFRTKVCQHTSTHQIYFGAKIKKLSEIASIIILFGARMEKIKTPWTIVADSILIFFSYILIYIFFFNFSEKIRFRISYDSSARQRIHMKCHILPSLEKKRKKKKEIFHNVICCCCNWHFKV